MCLHTEVDHLLILSLDGRVIKFGKVVAKGSFLDLAIIKTLSNASYAVYSVLYKLI